MPMQEKPKARQIHRCAAPLGPSEIAELVGLSRQRVDQLSRQRDFPEPWAELKTGRVWRDTDIEAWAANRRLPGREKR